MSIESIPQSIPLVFVGGLLGSAHCVGMCGGLALSVGATSNRWKNNLSRQIVFSGGRITTYSSMGAIAGFVGSRLNQSLAALVPMQAILALVAGGLLIVQGLNAAGIRRNGVAGSQHPCLLPRFLSTFLTTPGWTSTFMAGVFTGFLPCGLVYAFLALAAATQNMLAGWITMFAFGLGTLPIMVVTGLGASLLTLATRRRTLQAAGWCVMLAGMLSIVRGAGFILPSASSPKAGQVESGLNEVNGDSPSIDCPFCKK